MFTGSAENLEASFSFRAGWCRLTLSVDGESAVYRATGIEHDFFSDLVTAIAQISSGATIATTLWGDEPGGVFFDFAKAGPEHTAFSVQEMQLPEWITPSDPPWAPLRGKSLMASRVPTLTLMTAWADAFAAVQKTLTGDEVTGWGRKFPTGTYSALRAELQNRRSA
ncbi:hypothetical protein [Streptomyces sp. N2A]|uniref:hypothetical protein n=1 Tax=Streptomyces sp. N2A TaxID=3073936 RepID=UPI00287001B7|nr:hypothetical protein [Streptomyces sp. N2A]